MRKNVRFWRNVALIAAAHIVLIIGLIHWGHKIRRPGGTSIVWMGGVPGDGGPAQAAAPLPKTAVASVPHSEETPEPSTREEEVKKEEPNKEEKKEEERPILTAVDSEIKLPSPKPSPEKTTTPKPTPKARPTPREKEREKEKKEENKKPKKKSTPKPKPSEKPKKKSESRKLLAKATPKPSPKAKRPPKKTEEASEETEGEAEKKRIAKAALGKSESDGGEVRKAVAARAGNGKGESSGGGGHAGGGSIESQFGWYGNMLHDRLYSEWVQPIAVAASGEKFSVLAKLRIEQDGRVTSFEIVKSSGNETVDESVSQVAKRVTHVDPLPAGLGDGDHYDVKINFELNSEQ